MFYNSKGSVEFIFEFEPTILVTLMDIQFLPYLKIEALDLYEI